ncbi:MAG: permease [Candidatus Aenigmatarchaeota archaeon]|nr:MAG: permease [Candidatus Aenigmarchaeota archaeon]
MAKEDRTDPICGMSGHIKAHGKYFCSESCIRKYEKKEGMKKNLYCAHCVDSSGGGPKRWYQERLYQVLMILVALFLLDQGLTFYGITSLNMFWHAFFEYTALIWWALLLGFLLGGVIDYLVPREYISKFLSKGEKKTIGWSVILGFLMTACSHGILAIGMELYRKGASVPSVVSFLMASPWANLPVTLLLFSFFGLNAFLIIVSAIVIAIITGIIFQGLDRLGWIERSKHTAHVSEEFSVRKDMKQRWKKYRKNPNTKEVVRGVADGSWSLTKMILWWIIRGMILAAAANAFITPEIFMTYMGPTLIGLFITLIVATVIEVCSEGSAPLSFEIFRQTGALGNSFTFLMAGVATDYTEIGLIATNIGRRAALMLPIVTVPQILVLGYLFNLLI